MKEKRKGHACIVDEETNTIHVIGGMNYEHRNINSTEKWTFGNVKEGQTWDTGANLPEGVENSAAVASNSVESVGCLIGGSTVDGLTSKMWSLRRRDMKWIEVGSKKLKIARQQHTLVNTRGDKMWC